MTESTTSLKLIERIYDDALSPSVKKVGNALGAVIGAATYITIPFYIIENHKNYILEKNLNKYKEELNKIPEEKIIEVQPELGVPILEKLNYYDNEKLSYLFVELLKKASNRDEISKVHPKYINLIEQISEDEAVILDLLHKNKINRINYVTLKISNSTGAYKEKIKYFSFLKSSDLKLIFIENIDLYVNNLCSIGILKDSNGQYKNANEGVYKDLENELNEIYNTDELSEGDFTNIGFIHGILDITDLGKSFLEAIY